jgi:hypothetical protein
MVVRAIGALVGLCLSVSPVTSQQVPPDESDAVELIEMMLGRVPSRYQTPLAAMHGSTELYTRTHDQARAKEPGALGVWILFGDLALRSVDAGLSQSYAADMLPLYRQQPEDFLAVLSAAPWLAPSACHHLSAHFGSEDRPESGRLPFLTSEKDRFASALPTPTAAACLNALATPK